MSPSTRVLLIASKLGYQTDDFARAAERLNIQLLLATDRCHMLADIWTEGAIALNFRDPRAAAETIAAEVRHAPIAGIVATDELTAVIAAHARLLLGLSRAPDDAAGAIQPGQQRALQGALAAGDKLQFRQLLSAAGRRQPTFVAVAAGASLDEIRAAMDDLDIAYPVVVKPLHLTASKGVMRANDGPQLRARSERLTALLCDPEVQVKNPAAAQHMLIEEFIAGSEVAYEGLLQNGQLRTLAIFDKPEPLDGPFFAETMYVTPSREPAATQTAIATEVAAAARAIGLREGPVHAELRLSARGPVVIELAARAIGGLCHRTLRFAGGATLEELILHHAAGRPVTDAAREATASGVYMLPVPRAGVLRAIDGLETARAVANVTDVVITARVGDHVLPLPEGNTYMGFIFAQAGQPLAVEHALQRAAAQVTFAITTTL